MYTLVCRNIDLAMLKYFGSGIMVVAYVSTLSRVANISVRVGTEHVLDGSSGITYSL